MKKLTFFFDGIEVSAIPGQSIGAALLESGRKVLRSTRIENKPRGMFCGIGVCFDCLVVINGVPNQRACLTEVAEAIQVINQQGSGAYPIEGAS